MKTKPPVLTSETRAKWNSMQVRDLVVVRPVFKPKPPTMFQLVMDYLIQLKMSVLRAMTPKPTLVVIKARPSVTPPPMRAASAKKPLNSSISELLYQQLGRNIEMKKAAKAKEIIQAVVNESTPTPPVVEPVAQVTAAAAPPVQEIVQHEIPAAVNDAILKLKVDHAAMLQTNREVLAKLRADHEAMVREDQAAAVKAEHDALLKFKLERDARKAKLDQDALLKLKVDHAAMVQLKAEQAADAHLRPELKGSTASPNSAISNLIQKQIEMRKLREAAKAAEVNLSNLLQTYSLQQMICKNELEITELKNTLDSNINDDVPSGKAVEILKLLVAQRNRLKGAVKTLDDQVKQSVATIGNHVTEKQNDKLSEERSEMKKKESNFVKILSALGKKSPENTL